VKSWLNKDRLLAGTIIAGVSALGTVGPAFAQGDEEIVVTGSRIARPDLVSVSPVATVGTDEVTFSGTNAIENLLNDQPAVIAEFDQGVGNGTSGTATVDLRGLTSVRTLVLVDGRRLMPGDPRLPSPDLNNIPAQLVERVDIVTGGASAVYGSDAVAGVVNFIMKDDFEGIQLDAGYGFAWHHNENAHMQGLIDDFNAIGASVNRLPIDVPDDVVDGESVDFSILMGVNTPDGRGNITAYAGYRNLQPISQGQRDYGACSLATNTTNGIYDVHFCFGSSNHAYGRFVTPLGNLANNPANPGTFRPNGGALAFNFAPYNYYQQQDDKYTAGFFGHYEVNENFEMYSRLMFAQDTQTATIAPSGLFVGGFRFAINCQNPLLSDVLVDHDNNIATPPLSQRSAICAPNANIVPNNDDPSGEGTIRQFMDAAYRFASVPRTYHSDHNAYTLVMGARGAIADGWDYDASLQYGHTGFQLIFTGDGRVSRINNALNVITDAGGNPICANAQARAQGCVPLNLFLPLSQGITQEALNYVLTTAFQTGSTTEQIATGVITGDLSTVGLKSPAAEEGVGVAFGAEYRRESLLFQVDPQYQSGDLTGSGGITLSNEGDFDVIELFGEVRIPLVENKPFFDTLALEAGYRYSDYNPAGETEAYKLSGEWGPTEDVRFRGGYNRAVRAPNIVELFTPQTVGLFAGQDPCAGAAAGKPAGCANTFTPATIGFFGSVPACPAGQCSTLQGGNELLEVEQSDTYTAGLVFTPTFLTGFTATVDWYSIKISNPISTVGSNTILNQCVNEGIFCDLVRRNPVDGSLVGIVRDGPRDGYVIDLNLNTGFIETKGIDFGANWRIGFDDIGIEGGGALTFNFNGTYVSEFTINPTEGVGTYDCAGLYGITCGRPTPEWRHTVRATWETPWNIALSGNWRHIGEVSLDVNSENPLLQQFENTIDAVLPSFDYFDIAGTWDVNDKVRFRAGINNVTDEDPPVVDSNFQGISGPPYGNGNTFPGTYDSLGRTVFLGITSSF
jgi:outer membrane receptor protein involved in Fe transport